MKAAANPAEPAAAQAQDLRGALGGAIARLESELTRRAALLVDGALGAQLLAAFRGFVEQPVTALI